MIPVTFGSVVKTDADLAELKAFGSNRTETVTRTVKDLRFNALVSSIQMFLALVSASFAITVSVYFAWSFDGTVNLFFLIAYMCTGLGVMVVLKVYSDSLLTSGEKTGDEDDNNSSRDRLVLIGMTIFYVTGCLLDLCHVISSVNCDSVWKSCDDRYIYVSYVSELAFRVLRIVYLGAQTLFCFAFSKSTFVDRPATRYGLMFLQAVNLSLWFNSLVNESSHLFLHRPHQSRFYERCLGNASNVTKATLGCVYHNNTLFQVTDVQIGGIFMPFTIEFTLLVGQYLIYQYFHCIPRHTTAGTTHLEDADARKIVHGEVSAHELSDDIIAEKDEKEEEEEEGEEEEEVEEEEEAGIVSLYANESRGLMERSSNSGQSLLISGVCVFVILSVNVAMCLLALFFRFNVLTNDPLGRKVMLGYILAFWTIMLLSIMIGYLLSGTFPYCCDLPYNGLDYILLLTSVGPLTFDVLTMIAAAEMLKRSAEIPSSLEMFSPVQMLVVELINVLEVYFQATFCSFARRVVVSDEDGCHRAIFFRCVILFLAVSNGTLWFLGSCGAYENYQQIQMTYFGRNNWLMINNLVTPLSLFFRFNSCLMLAKIYLRMHVHNNDDTLSINLN